MGNTKSLGKTIATGIPVVADMVDGEFITVKDSGLLYQRVDKDTLIKHTVNPLVYNSYTVATLPTGEQGDVAYVTDALTPSYLSTVVGGGSVVCPVFHDGTNWICR